MCGRVCMCRVLSTDSNRIAMHYSKMVSLLKPLGLSPEDVRSLVLKLPSLLLLSPVTTAAKLDAVKVCCVCEAAPPFLLLNCVCAANRRNSVKLHVRL